MNGVAHERATVVTAVLCFVSFSLATGDIVSASALGAGAAIGIVLSPDIDLYGTLPARRLRSIPIAGVVLRLQANIYARLFSHRGVSHVPIVGTFTRWLFFPIPFFLALFFVPLHYLTLLFIGHSLADIVHFTLDRVKR